MKKLIAADTETAGSSRSYISHAIGLIALALIVAGVSFWMATQDSAATAATANQTLPPVQSSATQKRFREEAWSLPNEPLLGFVDIPAGAFLMGSDPTVDHTAYQNEQWSASSNQGTVDLPEFYVGRYEVTVAQFRAFVNIAQYHVDPQTLRSLGGSDVSPDLPVTNISWTDALAYTRWLEASLKNWSHTPQAIEELLNGDWHISLPNEAQWEKAARSDDGRIYPWGNIANREFTNFSGTGVMPVGSFHCPNCAYQLADMSGNVWELTRSFYRPYPFDADGKHLDLRSDALLVMRGGSYAESPNNIRAAVRGGVDPGARRPFIGFRVVLTQF